MEVTFNHLLQTRKNIISVLKSVRGREHIIPEGFSNNIYWNAAHCLVTQNLLCYKLSGLEIPYDVSFIESYKKGTKANTEAISDDKIDWLLQELELSVLRMEQDYNNDIFKSYNEYPTSYGVSLKSAEEAIQFNNLHEGLHLGYMMAIRKVL